MSLKNLDLTKHNLREDLLSLKLLGRGMAWIDTGTCDLLHEAFAYIQNLEKRQGLKIGGQEEVAWRLHWISDQELADLAAPLHKSGRGTYHESLLLEPR